MTVKDLLENNKISVNAYNLCRRIGINTVEDLLYYYYPKKTFLNSKTRERKAAQELLELVTNFNTGAYAETYPNRQLLHQPFLGISAFEKEILNNYIQILLPRLSVRSFNAIHSILPLIKIDEIIETVFHNQSFKIAEIKNVGRATVPEIEEFFDNIKSLFYHLRRNSDDFGKQKLILKIFLDKNFPEIDFYETDHEERFSIIKLVEKILFSSEKYNQTEKFLIGFSLNIFQCPSISIEETATKLSLTYERIRQIRKQIVEDFPQQLKVLESFAAFDNSVKLADNSSYFYFVDEEQVGYLNTCSSSKFSSAFLTLLFSIVNDDTYFLLGNCEDVFIPKSKEYHYHNRHNWKSLYLFSRKLDQKIDFYGLFNELSFELKQSYSTKQELDFEGFVHPYYSGPEDELSTVIEALTTIANNEFKEVIIDGKIVIEPTKKQTLEQLIIITLDTLGIPSKDTVIFNELQKNFNRACKNVGALRSICHQCDEIIIFGRSSTYGLKKWETERSNIKGGTIKDIIIEYLQQQTQPIHLRELLEEVHKYRDITTPLNLLINLKIDPKKRFVIYNQYFIGLADKQYTGSLTSLPKFLGKTIKNLYEKNFDEQSIRAYLKDSFYLSDKNISYILENVENTIQQ